MKYRALLLMLLLFSLTTDIIFAQDQDDEPLPPPKRAGSTKFGGAIGFTQGLLFLNVDPINQVMLKENLAPFSGNGLAMLGGQGYGYIMLVQNLRIGYIWMNGKMKSKTLSGNTVREVDLSANYTGATFDYTIPVVPRLDVSVGMMIGGGGISFDFTRNYGLGQQWNGTWDNFGSSTPADEYSGKLSGSFFIWQPSLNVEFAVLRWVQVRAGVSYLGMAGGSWQRDDRYDLYGVPDDISGKGWTLNSGIFIGTFLF